MCLNDTLQYTTKSSKSQKRAHEHTTQNRRGRAIGNGGHNVPDEVRTLCVRLTGRMFQPLFLTNRHSSATH